MVTIYDGPTTSDPVMFETSTNGDTFASLSTSFKVVVSFVSNAPYRTGKGWQLNYIKLPHNALYSYNNGDFTNWNVQVPYAASPTVDVNGTMTLLLEEVTGVASSASMSNLFVGFFVLFFVPI